MKRTTRHPATTPSSSGHGGLALLAGLGAGALAMYLCDPKQGAHRRGHISSTLHDLTGSASHAAHDAADTAHDYASHLGNAAHRARHFFSHRLERAKAIALDSPPRGRLAGLAVAAAGALSVGVGAMYLLDPVQGRHRRNAIFSIAADVAAHTGHALSATGSSLFHQLERVMPATGRWHDDNNQHPDNNSPEMAASIPESASDR